MKLFLKLKHWQLFILQFALPVFLQLMSLPFFLIYGFRAFLVVFPLSMILYLFGHHGWMWSVTNHYYSRLPAGVKMNIKLFRFFLIFASVYIMIFSGLVGSFMVSSFSGFPYDMPAQDPPVTLFVTMAALMPFHFFAMFCIFYSIYFTAKVYRSAELQREALLSEYIVEFILIWFYYIGVWIIQPKINEQFKKTE